MEITSSAFTNGGRIPVEYTCDGKNSNPPLTIAGVPGEAKSLVLIMDDVDAPGGVFDHWLIWNITPGAARIESGQAVGMAGKNSFGKVGYGGPCPGQGEHRYYFRVFALDRELALVEGASRKELEEAMAGCVLAGSELLGKYERE